MAVFTDEQLREIDSRLESFLEKNGKKVAEYLMKDHDFVTQVKKLAIDELTQKLKS